MLCKQLMALITLCSIAKNEHTYNIKTFRRNFKRANCVLLLPLSIFTTPAHTADIKQSCVLDCCYKTKQRDDPVADKINNETNLFLIT